MERFSVEQLKDALKNTESRIESNAKEIATFVAVRNCLLKRRAEIKSALKDCESYQ